MSSNFEVVGLLFLEVVLAWLSGYLIAKTELDKDLVRRFLGKVREDRNDD